ncbi:hypothetical protein KUCAC02_000349, partial [Chaenocephalus aceratus]
SLPCLSQPSLWLPPMRRGRDSPSPAAAALRENTSSFQTDTEIHALDIHRHKLEREHGKESSMKHHIPHVINNGLLVPGLLYLDMDTMIQGGVHLQHRTDEQAKRILLFLQCEGRPSFKAVSSRTTCHWLCCPEKRAGIKGRLAYFGLIHYPARSATQPDPLPSPIRYPARSATQPDPLPSPIRYPARSATQPDPLPSPIRYPARSATQPDP